MAAREPRLLVVEGMEDKRIIYESAGEKDYGPMMRRMEFYALSPKTFQHACNEVMNYHGIDARAEKRWEYQAHPDSERFVLPLLMTRAGGGEELKEWAIDL